MFLKKIIDSWRYKLEWRYSSTNCKLRHWSEYSVSRPSRFISRL